MTNPLLEQFISICYHLISQPTVPVQLPSQPVQPVQELKEAMDSFNRMMGLGTPDMPTKDDLAID